MRYSYQPTIAQRLGGVAALLVVAGIVYASWERQSGAPTPSAPARVSVVLTEGLTRQDIAQHIGARMAWSEEDTVAFRDMYARMAFREFNALVFAELARRYDWGKLEREVFFTHGDLYRAPERDVLRRVYVPGRYTFAPKVGAPQIAGELVTRVSAMASTSAYVRKRLDDEAAEAVAQVVAQELELLPDIVPLPPQDLKLVRRDGRILLLFSTTYYNQGEGPLELVADPATRGVAGDIERNVLQYVHRSDGQVRTKPVGRFAWHEEHLHYHFTDFITYELTPLTAATTTTRIDRQTKATFCIRDVSRVNIENPYAAEAAAYRICGKERQGVSVGWGDTYFHTYPDQHIDVTGLPPGVYELSFEANPEDRFDELTRANNHSSVRLRLDVASSSVEGITTRPVDNPEVEHVHREQAL